MSALTPILAEWMRRGLEWIYIEQTTMSPFEIPARGQFQVPTEGYTFTSPEGVLLHLSAAFDHPSCGIRVEAEPEFDSEDFFTVGRIAALGTNRPENLVYAMIPPITLPGTYVIRVPSPWIWKNWMRIYLINTDSVPHRVLAHGYHIIALKGHGRIAPGG